MGVFFMGGIDDLRDKLIDHPDSIRLIAAKADDVVRQATDFSFADHRFKMAQRNQHLGICINRSVVVVSMSEGQVRKRSSRWKEAQRVITQRIGGVKWHLAVRQVATSSRDQDETAVGKVYA